MTDGDVTPLATGPRPTRPAAQVWPARCGPAWMPCVEDGRWRAPREFDARGPGGRPRRGTGGLLRLQRLPGAERAPGRGGRRRGPPWSAGGPGAGASRLVTGSRPVHTELEAALAAWKGTDAAVCFPTGFAANLGALSVLGGPAVRVLSDELNHASIIDGVPAVPLSGVDLPPLRRGAPRRPAGGGPDHPDHRGHRHGVLHGRRCRPGGGDRRPVPPPRRPAPAR